MKNITKKLLGLAVLGILAIGMNGCDKKLSDVREEMNTTRIDALVAMTRSDIASTLKAIPAEVFAANRNVKTNAPQDYADWGSYIIATAELDKSKWQASSNGVEPILDGKAYCGVVIWIDTQTGTLRFDANKIKSGNKLCEALRKSYIGTKHETTSIPLKSLNDVSF